MKWFWRFLWLMWGQKLVVREVKRRTLVIYLRTLRATRLSLIGALTLFLILQLMMLAGVGALVTGFLLWNQGTANNLEILFGIFLGLFILPAAALSIFLSERAWMRASGAHKMIRELQDPPI